MTTIPHSTIERPALSPSALADRTPPSYCSRPAQSSALALAAAAPDLLAALIDVMSDPYFARAATRYGHARAAIAKAQGGAL